MTARDPAWVLFQALMGTSCALVATGLVISAAWGLVSADTLIALGGTHAPPSEAPQRRGRGRDSISTEGCSRERRHR